MNLHLVLTYHWFDEINLGDKRIEYRAMSAYWRKRIWEKREEIKTVTFARGYTSETVAFDVTHIDTGECPYSDWDDTFYRIHFK